MQITIHYEDLNFAALVKIFQLADLLGITPKRATEVYLSATASASGKQAEPGRATK